MMSRKTNPANEPQMSTMAFKDADPFSVKVQDTNYFLLFLFPDRHRLALA